MSPARPPEGATSLSEGQGHRPQGARFTWNNPLIPQRADPHLSLVDGRYWFTASVPAFDAIELR